MYDPDPEKVRKFCEVFPQAKPAASEEEILKDPEVKLVAGAAVTSERCALGLRVMAAGKDCFTDKAPLTTLEEREYRAASSIPAASRNPGEGSGRRL